MRVGVLIGGLGGVRGESHEDVFGLEVSVDNLSVGRPCEERCERKHHRSLGTRGTRAGKAGSILGKERRQGDMGNRTSGSISHLQFVHELDGLEKLEGKVLQRLEREWFVAVDTHGLKEGWPQFGEGHAHMASIVKPFPEWNAVFEASGVVLLESVEDLELMRV